MLFRSGWQSAFPIGSTALRPGVPVMSARWDTGVEAGWRHNIVELSTAVTLGAPSVPRLQTPSDGLEWSGRAAVHLPSGVVLGASGARGSWIDRRTLALMPADRRESAQSLVGADIEIGRGHWLVRAEWMRSLFQVPIASGPSPVVPLVASAAFAEARYRVRPRWQLAVRVDTLSFSSVQGAVFNSGQPTPWDAAVQRIEFVTGFRLVRRADLRAGWQYDWRDGGFVHEHGYPALQLLVWF